MDVVPVSVSNQEVETVDAFLEKFHTQLANTSAAIENDDGSVVNTDLHARRVATIFCGVGPRRWDRAPCSPESDKHPAGWWQRGSGESRNCWKARTSKQRATITKKGNPLARKTL